MLNNFICANFVFNSSFDSGNLHKVEHVKSPVDCKLKNRSSLSDKCDNFIHGWNYFPNSLCCCVGFVQTVYIYEADIGRALYE